MKFNFWPFRTAQDDVNELMDAIKKESTIPLKETPPMPAVQPPKKKDEYYRVGWNSNDNMVTLTLTPEGGWSTTLSLSPMECERMIRMLRSTYQVETPTNEVD